MTSAPAVLLVADDSQLAYVLQRYAASYGAQLIAADFNAPIVALAVQAQPALILLSVAAPHERTQAALGALRSDPQTRPIPIVLCTAQGIDRHGWAAEADRVLAQPVMYADFAALLDHAIQPAPRTDTTSKV